MNLGRITPPPETCNATNYAIAASWDWISKWLRGRPSHPMPAPTGNGQQGSHAAPSIFRASSFSRWVVTHSLADSDFHGHRPGVYGMWTVWCWEREEEKFGECGAPVLMAGEEEGDEGEGARLRDRDSTTSAVRDRDSTISAARDRDSTISAARGYDYYYYYYKVYSSLI